MSISVLKLLEKYGWLTFELKSGDITDAEVSRVDEIVGNEIVSLDK
jgi:hypothetical protein